MFQTLRSPARRSPSLTGPLSTSLERVVHVSDAEKPCPAPALLDGASVHQPGPCCSCFRRWEALPGARPPWLALCPPAWNMLFMFQTLRSPARRPPSLTGPLSTSLGRVAHVSDAEKRCPALALLDWPSVHQPVTCCSCFRRWEALPGARPPWLALCPPAWNMLFMFQTLRSPARRPPSLTGPLSTSLEHVVHVSDAEKPCPAPALLDWPSVHQPGTCCSCFRRWEALPGARPPWLALCPPAWNMLFMFQTLRSPARRPPSLTGPLSTSLGRVAHVSDAEKPCPAPALLDWPSVHQRMAWNVILILGGGFALAESCKVTPRTLPAPSPHPPRHANTRRQRLNQQLPAAVFYLSVIF